MYHEKEFIKPDGKYYLRVGFSDFRGEITWNLVTVWGIPKGKRKRVDMIDNDSHIHRSKSFPEGRTQHIKEQIDAILTKEEQASAFQELYDLIKPPQLR